METRGNAMRSILGLVVLAAFSLSLGPACASRSGSDGATERPAERGQARSEKPQGVPPPAGSLLSKVQVGMTETDVRKAAGEPTAANAYITGKQFIPWYFGPDTTRSDWKYAGQGRVVFSRNQYTGELKVIRVDYDPNETGK